MSLNIKQQLMVPNRTKAVHFAILHFASSCTLCNTNLLTKFLSDSANIIRCCDLNSFSPAPIVYLCWLSKNILRGDTLTHVCRMSVFNWLTTGVFALCFWKSGYLGCDCLPSPGLASQDLVVATGVSGQRNGTTHQDVCDGCWGSTRGIL